MPAAAGQKKKCAAPWRVPKRGKVLKRVFASLFSWLPARRRHNRSPRGRRGNSVPAGGGHVEPEPDVAAARRASNGSPAAHSHVNNHDNNNTNYPPADATNY